jgi:multiple sugar transport system substrate-binding protein
MGMAVEASYENAFNDRYHGLEPDEYEGNALTNWLWNLDTFEPVVNNPKALKALQDVVDLYNSGAVAPGSLKKLWMDQMDDISKGRVVMMINWPGVASSLTDKAVNPYADVMGYAPMPYWPERPGSRRIWGLSYPVGITKASKHKDEAYKWLWYATQPEQAIRLMRTKKMPSVCQKGVLDNQELWNEFPLLEPQYKNAKDDIGTPTVAEWFQIWNGIGASVQRAAEKNIEAAKALEEAETLLRDLFKERGYLK